MEQTVIRYWNKKLNLGMVDWRTVYLLSREPSFKTEIYNGTLVYHLSALQKDFDIQILKQGCEKEDHHKSQH
jgi:hypothetical protein